MTGGRPFQPLVTHMGRVYQRLADIRATDGPTHKVPYSMLLNSCSNDPAVMEALIAVTLSLIDRYGITIDELRSHAAACHRQMTVQRRRWTGINTWHWEER